MVTFNKKISISLFLNLGTLLGLTFLVIGCSSYPNSLTKNGQIKIERIDSQNANISAVQVYPENGQLKVIGYLKKRHQQKGRISGYLHLDLLDKEGQILSHKNTDYHRDQRRSGRSHFIQSFEIEPNKVESIRVTHYRLADDPHAG